MGNGEDFRPIVLAEMCQRRRIVGEHRLERLAVPPFRVLRCQCVAAGVRTADGGARKRAYDQALRPPQRPSHARSGRTDSAVAVLSQFECRLMTPTRHAWARWYVAETGGKRSVPVRPVGGICAPVFCHRLCGRQSAALRTQLADYPISAQGWLATLGGDILGRRILAPRCAIITFSS
jgi:hypothetical protein